MEMSNNNFKLLLEELQTFLEDNYLGEDACFTSFASDEKNSCATDVDYYEECCSKLELTEKCESKTSPDESNEICAEKCCMSSMSDYSEPEISGKSIFKDISLEELLRRDAETFSQKLIELIIKKNIDEVEVYKRSHIDRKLFSKLRRKDYRPSKNTVLALIIGLRLNMDEAKELLSYAGFTFSPCEKTDLIVSFFLEKGKYNINDINEALYLYGERCLGN